MFLTSFCDVIFIARRETALQYNLFKIKMMMMKMKTYVFHAQNAIFSQYELQLMNTNGSPVLFYIL